MTWYENKTKKEAITGSYGSWLSPEGELIPVDHQEHSWVASKILGEKYESMTAEDQLLAKGYAALKYLGGLAVRHNVGLTDIQIQKILALYKAQNTPSAHVQTMGENKRANDATELFFILNDSKIAGLGINSKVIKQATLTYGHWISPTGQVIEVEEYQGHHNTAKQILEDMDVVSTSKFGYKGDLMEMGWAKTAYEASEMLISSDSNPNDQQADIIQKLAQMAPKRIAMFLVEIPNKMRYIQRHQIGQLKDYLTSSERRIWADKNPQIIKTAQGTKTIKTAKTDLSKFEEFLKNPEKVEVNPKNQVSNHSGLYDVQRYVMDSYSIKTSISKTKTKITVAMFVNHAFLGSLAFNKYWTFTFDEWEDAVDLYKKINKISEETIEEFINEEITTTVFWPILKHKLDALQPERNAATNIPWVNYSRYYTEQENPDWRQNIYGNRYPVYNEPSYEQETKRKGVFFD